MRPFTTMRRFFFIACTIVAVAITPPGVADETADAKKIDVAPQQLSSALQDFSEQSGLQVAYVATLADNVNSKGTHDAGTAEAALSEILDSTGLEYQFVNTDTVAIGPILAANNEAADPGNAQTAPSRMVLMAQASQTTQVLPSSTASRSGPEDRAFTIEEIIVTAQKREQELIDVPISITVLSGEQLEKAGINNMQDLSFAVPGMANQEIGPGRQNLSIRGLGTTKGSSSLVGIYLDEMPLTGPQDGFVSTYVALDVLDLERVEVLKGPQGTLFGEGSVGGTVRFITRDPQLDSFGGDVSASMFSTSDSGWSEKASLVLNVPIAENKFGVRLATAYTNSAGWIDKVQTVNGPVIDEDINDSEILDVRLKALWTPTDEVAVKGMVVVHRGEAGGTHIVNVGDRKDSNFIIGFAPFTPTDSSDDFELYNLTATYDFSGAQLLSSTSHADMSSVAVLFQRRAIRDTAANPSGGPRIQEILQPDYALDSTSFSQELRLSSTGSGALQWTVGAFYKDAELIQNFISGLDFYRFGLPVALNALRGLKATTKSESWTVFGDATYALTTRVEIGAGVRYFEDEREAFNAGVPDVTATFLSGSFDATTWRAYLSYALTEDVRVYGSATTGFRSGGFNTLPVVGAGAPATFDPEEVISYELGTKMNLAGGRLSIETALFYSNWLDVQGPNFFTPPGGTPAVFTSNVGEARMKGIEWAMNWLATDRLTLSLSGDVTDTKVTKIGLVPNPPLFVGDPVDMVPKYSLSFGADYGFDWSAGLPGYVRLQHNVQGKSTLTSRNLDLPNPQDSTPVLQFLNASIGADWGGWGIELFARNLLDEDGAVRPGSGLTAQARPRTVGVRFAKSF